MKPLTVGSKGAPVRNWQTFLRGQGFSLSVTSVFDTATIEATRAFQKKNHVRVDGTVGSLTFAKAGTLGFELVDASLEFSDYPQLPSFPPILGNAKRQQLFGPLEHVPAPTKNNPEAIRITNKWEENLVRVVIPQLIGIKGASKDGSVRVHRLAVNQMLAVWKAFDEAGLLKRVITFDGLYNPRYIRGGAAGRVLSNHAFATAFDINAAYNALGSQPAHAGSQGCVFDLVPTAHRFGFYWGGHFKRRDGMHFEIAEIRA